MNMEPKLSVVIPVYNTEKYLEKCLDSLLKQTYKNLEIIIVNDASKGNVNNIVKEYQKDNKNIKLIQHEVNRGLFQARMTGMENAGGEFFAFLDSDDAISVDFYRLMIEAAIEKSADIVVGEHLEVYNDGRFYSPHNMFSQKDWDLYDEEILKGLLEQRGLDFGWWVVWNKIYSKKIWDKSLPVLRMQKTHLIMCEDIAYSVNFFSNAKHLVNVRSGDYYYYYKHEQASTVKKKDFKGYKKNLMDIDNAFNIAKEALIRADRFKKYKLDLEQWKNYILNIWKYNIKEDTNLKRIDKKNLVKYIDTNIVNEEKNIFNLDNSFCSSGAIYNGKNFIAEIKNAITDKDCEVVSFDMFDTLILRPFLYPTDLFVLMDSYINKIIPTTDFIGFSGIRIHAEEIARKKKYLNNPMWEEVSLDEIYNTIGELCTDLSEYLDEIKELEISLEVKYCNIRNVGKELLECAIAAGKKVICVSDMYMPKEVLEKILEKNKLNKFKNIYVSSEIGLTKGSGKLYDYVRKNERISDYTKIVHIGDNYHSDVEMAKKYRIKAFHLPKTVDMIFNGNGAIYSGDYFHNCFEQQKGYRNTKESMYTLGIRCMLAVVANKLYDNPFVMYLPFSDFNADSYTIGYFCLGMHLFAIVDWLRKEVEENKYNNLHFMARDGYLPMKGFEILNTVFKLPINIYYSYMSRKAILPLMINKNEDFYAMYKNFDLSTMTPEKFLEVSRPIVKNKNLKNAEEILNKRGIPYNSKFENIGGFLNFGKVFLEIFYDKDLAKDYIDNFKNYFKGQFEGKTATFDIGYSARIESTLVRNFNYDITAHYLHTNNDSWFGRIDKSGVKVKTMYTYSPFITGIMREHMLSELGPSCIAYEKVDGEFGPVFEKFTTNIQTKFVTETIQGGAQDFIKDMVKIFGEDLRFLAYRKDDASLPLEYYLHRAKEEDKKIFKGTEFEDDMGIGAHNSLVDFWNHELNRWGSDRNYGVSIVNNFEQYRFFKRWMLIFLLDWREGKERFRRAFGKNPFIFNSIRNTYRGMRGIYRKLFK